MKHTFDEIITELDMAKEKISGFEHMSTRNLQNWKEKKEWKLWNKIPKNYGKIIKCVACM